MPTLYMFQGIPGSGKSYKAKELAAQEGGVIVSKDDIRAALATTCQVCNMKENNPQHSVSCPDNAGAHDFRGWVWSPEAEVKDVIPMRDQLIEEFLSEGRNVYSADTNFGREHKIALQKLARRHKAGFETIRMDVPLDVCLERNAKREARVPEKVIKNMFYKYIASDPDRWPNSAPSQYTPIRYLKDESLMKAIICDLDGTLAIKHDGRGYYEYDSCDKDTLVPHVQRLIRLYHNQLHYQIVYLSGREESGRASTEKFLLEHNCPPGPLIMRSTGDRRKDRLVKLELFNEHVRGKYNVDFVLDDRDQVVKMWRELGIPCFQVAPGDF